MNFFITKKTTILTITLFSALIISCTKQEPVNFSEKEHSLKEDVTIIPVETALETMYDFLAEISPKTTKSVEERKVLSIETHFIPTRSGDAFPDAYLVNFEDEQGFAVLGANTSVAPVIAVIESGNTDWNSILHPEEEELSDFVVDCADPGIKPNRLLSFCITAALQGRTEDSSLETKSDSYLTDIGPLTSDLLFNQHVTYCHKPNWSFVVNGCASTALGIVVAHNRYPSIRADYELLDYSKCNKLDGEGILYEFKSNYLYLPLRDYYTNSSSIPHVDSLPGLSDSEKIKLITTIDNSVINKHGTPKMPAESYKMLFNRTEYKLTSSII